MAQEMAWWVSEECRDGLTSIKLLKSFEGWAKNKGAHIIVMGSLDILSGDRVNRFYEKKGMFPAERLYGGVI